MSDSKRKKILATVSAEDFIGRTAETDTLLQHAKGENTSRGLLLLSAPALGASELLKQTYDQLFYEQGDAIPFYFSFKKTDKTAKQAALRFLQTFLQQIVAFRRKARRFSISAPDVCELAQLAAAVGRLLD